MDRLAFTQVNKRKKNQKQGEEHVQMTERESLAKVYINTQPRVKWERRSVTVQYTDSSLEALERFYGWCDALSLGILLLGNVCVLGF